MKNKIISLVVLIAVLVSISAVPAFAGAAPSVTVGSAKTKPGDTVEIPVVLANNTGFSSLGIEIGYDRSALTLTNAVAESTGATFTKAQSFDVNPYNMSWDSAGNVAYNGTLVTLTFEVSDTASGDYAITVDYYKGRNGNYVDGENVNYDENFAQLNLSYADGKITVEESGTPDKPDEPDIQGAYVTVGSANTKPGGTVEIPVVLANNTGFSSLGIEIGYDRSALTLTNAVAESTGATFTKAQSFDVNPYNMSWDSAGNVAYNGTLVTLTFEVSDTASGDYAITVDYYKGRNGNYIDGENVNYDENFAPLNLSYVGGKITVTEEELPREIAVSSISEDRTAIALTLSGNTDAGSVYAASYTADEKMLAVKKYKPQADMDITFEKDEVGSTVKIIWMDGSMKPLCSAQEIKLK